MGSMTDLMSRSALELARLVCEGEVTSAELVEASLAAIESRDETINAFTQVDGERALAAATEVRVGDPRPFAGVPVAVKDLFAPVAGLVQSQGSDLFGTFSPPYEAFVVRRLREAGFVIVGTTSSPELGILPVTEPRRFGPTRNPHDPERTPGGSSGGAAAAVAGGMVPIAHGSDGAGSIRIPASCCGLVGLKPARGRISFGPELGDSMLAVHGMLSHTVADTAASLDVLAGYEPGDTTWATPPSEPFARAASREPGRLRIAMTLVPPLGVPIAPAWAQATRDAADLLTSLGHEVVEADLPVRAASLFEVFNAFWAATVGVSVSFGGTVAGRDPAREDVEALTWHLYERSHGISAIEFQRIVFMLQGFGRMLVSFLEPYDALLTPGLTEDPVPIGEIDGDGPDPEATFARAAAFTPFTATFNITGQPAISLPWWSDGERLPRSVQLVGRPAGEGPLLALASQVEAARPWADRRAALD